MRICGCLILLKNETRGLRKETFSFNKVPCASVHRLSPADDISSPNSFPSDGSEAEKSSETLEASPATQNTLLPESRI